MLRPQTHSLQSILPLISKAYRLSRRRASRLEVVLREANVRDKAAGARSAVMGVLTIVLALSGSRSWADPSGLDALPTPFQIADIRPTELPDSLREAMRPPALQALVKPSHLSSPVSVLDQRIVALGYDPAHVREALAAYRAGGIAAGDAATGEVEDPILRTALTWVAIRGNPSAFGFRRLLAFADAHPAWPSLPWLRRRMESLLLPTADVVSVASFFADRPPRTPAGKLALALALRTMGREADAVRLARATFREHDLTPDIDTIFMRAFGTSLTRADYKYRADRLIYDGRVAAGLWAARKASPDILALEEARVALSAGESNLSRIDTLTPDLRDDPGLVFARAQRLRHAEKYIEAARLLRAVPRNAAQLVDGDAWWQERRALARELLDAGKVNAAYITCAEHGAASPESEVDAEFHAGWIALRFLHDPVRATYHFWVAAKRAVTPMSVARIAYWQGRTAEVSDDAAQRAYARQYYERAAAYGETYYGQLARQSLGLPPELPTEPALRATGATRDESIRVIEILFALDERDTAAALALDAAQTISDPEQVGALGAVVSAQQDAHLALSVGKLLGQRGISVVSLAFPTFGVPAFHAVADSAPAAVVYAVARQESAFQAKARSTAGAQGLMQMIAATARRTAIRAGLSFTFERLVRDAAFNAQLGAAHLGALMRENQGSLILTFVAYNAGPGRVKDWVQTHGDPRKPGVDAVDWVERIPFTETRNYVQRVIANVGVYSALFGASPKGDAVAAGFADPPM